MANFVTLNGKVTTEADPARGMWYSVRCSFWTDDWSKVVKVGPGIPACPHCSSVGCQATMGDWMTGAERHQAEGNPGYVAFVNGIKETCHGVGMSAMEIWSKARAKAN